MNVPGYSPDAKVRDNAAHSQRLNEQIAVELAANLPM